MSDGRFAQVWAEARWEGNALAFEGKLLELCRIMTRAEEFAQFVDLLERYAIPSLPHRKHERVGDYLASAAARLREMHGGPERRAGMSELGLAAWSLYCGLFRDRA